MLKDIIILKLDVLQILLIIYFLIAAIYYWVFAVAGNFYKNKTLQKSTKFNKIAILIPAYREDNVIVNTTLKALNLNYPATFFDVFIIADHLQSETIHQLKQTTAHIIELYLEKSSKAKAINEAMKFIEDDKYTICLILDADNHAESDFLLKINDAFESGSQIIQTHRTAKNLNTNFAVLDAISEEINNHLFRKAHRVFGLPATLIGSGMAFPYLLFKKLISNAKTSFEDKEIEFMILKKGLMIDYLNDAIVFDEKIQNSSAFSRQRIRWVYSQIYFFSQYFFKSLPAFVNRKFKGLAIRGFSTALPPRIILLTFSFILSLIYLIIEPFSTYFYLWIITFLTSVLTILISIPKKFYKLKTIKSLISLPLAAIMMIKAIILSKKAKNDFMHTKHTGA